MSSEAATVAKTDKYSKTNDGIRRPMEPSSKHDDMNSLSDSAARATQFGHCKICDVKLPLKCGINHLELHNKGKKHQHMLRLQKELETSNGQVPNSKKGLVVQVQEAKTVQISEKNGHPLKNMSSETSTFEIPAEGPKTGESSFKPLSQRVLASPTPVSECKEHYEIQNPTAEMTDTDPAAIAMPSSSEGFMFMASHAFEVPSLKVGSSFEHALLKQVSKRKVANEVQNPTAEANIQPQSISVELHAPSGSSASLQTATGCSKSKAEQKIDILTCQSSTTQPSKLGVCLQCGDKGFPEALVFCNKCQVYALHRYCLAGPVIFTGEVTWFCEDCEPKVVETSFHDSYVSINLGNDASQARVEPKNCKESVKNKQEPQNIAAKAKVLLSDNHSLSQCNNNTEKKNKSEKECQPVPKDEAKTREGSLNVATDPHPIADPIWRGSLRLLDPSFGPVIGIFAHISNLACSKVLEETRFFPDVLCLDLLPRSAVWPKPFNKCGPNENCVALYFFPDSESAERAFDKLVDDMICLDLSIRAMVENAELLIFPSAVLPIQCRRFQEKYYLWGVFREKKLLTL